ncbi:MAG TPA: DUF1415 domain-containing protein [Puia sp.]|jgi:hypothetical protein|nr:DUF1415 domain-containing protein [Puia sp.]
MNKEENIITQTKKWIIDVVVGLNFCPFAARVIKMDSIHYQVSPASDKRTAGQALLQECKRLDENKSIDTSFLILPAGFPLFDKYLDLVYQAEQLLKNNGYEGIYQVASFHPLYRFAHSTSNDPANYTNRSPYPMLHLLREDLVEKALANYPDPEKIPERNIECARQKGEAYMKMLRDACLKVSTPGHNQL